MHADYYELVKDYLHPNIHTFIDHYRSGNLIDLSPFHGCILINRNGTRKLVRYELVNDALFQHGNAIGENQN